MNDENNTKYNLEERTAIFGENILEFCRSLNRNEITKPLIIQLVRSSTSVGANYCEANEASSKKDFMNKIFIAKKESKETRFWLRMIIKAMPDSLNKAQPLMQEAQELNLIFGAITQKR